MANIEEITVYKQIPFAKSKGRCCYCNSACLVSKEHKIHIYRANLVEFKIVTTHLMYCSNCNLYQTTAEHLRNIWKRNYGYFARGFSVNKSDKPTDITKRIKKSLIKNEDSNGNVSKYQGLPVMEKPNNYGFSPFEIYLSDLKFEDCPFCNIPLRNHSTFIPIDQSHVVPIDIRTCRRHYFSFQPELVSNLLAGNTFATFITTHSMFRHDNMPGFLELFNANDDYQYMILGKDNFENKDIVLIISNNTNVQLSSEVFVLNYKSQKVRSLLTSVFHDHDKIVRFNDKEISVSFIYNGKKLVTSYTPSQVVEKLVIKKGGGFACINPRFQLFDALLYSQKTHCYEIAKVTYDTESEFYFIDLRNYKDFVSKYGLASVKFVSAVNKYTDSDRFDYMSSESTLHECGYNVNARNGLNDQTRQAILADIINFGIMTPSDIYAFLEYLYNREKSERMCLARSKWKRDAEFVRHYKTDTNSFVITDFH